MSPFLPYGHPWRHLLCLLCVDLIDVNDGGKYSNYHISFDVDALDPIYMPCTGTPVEGGIATNDVLSIIDRWGEKCVSFDLVEMNLLVGDSKQQKTSIQTCETVLDKLLSKKL